MNWQTFGLFAGILALWAGFILGSVRWMLDQRFDDIKELVQANMGDVARVKDDLASLKGEIASLKAELPRDYIRREEWVRQVTVLDAKMDLWAQTMDRAVTEIRRMLYELRPC